jgi:hypothetical protein
MANTKVPQADNAGSVVEGAIANEPDDWSKMLASQKMKNCTTSTDKKFIKQFEESVGNKGLDEIDDFVDGEIIDVLEHFFWMFTDGIAMEIGALDGSYNTRSMTQELEAKYGWRRILVEGNPMYRLVNILEKSLY